MDNFFVEECQGRTRLIGGTNVFEVTDLLAAARREAFEEAAKACEAMDRPGGPFMDGETCAAAIRALVGGR